MPGILYIVSTPIGNLEDITLRALRVLKEVDCIAAEDTRHTRKLLSHFGISRPLVSYWGAKEKVKAEEVLEMLREGRDVALVTDAGTPGISDPGAVVIERAIEEEIPVIPVPGPSALIAALSVSGLPTREFLFVGFLQPKRSQRIKRLEKLSREQRTMILYESPHRLLDTLDDMLEVLGDRRVAVSHELTKFNESVHRGSLSEVIEEIEGGVIAGEYVIVIEGKTEESPDMEGALMEVEEMVGQGVRRKEAVRKVAEEYGLRKKELYDLSIGKGGEKSET
jgi:16S rRNA (cytidine1402-2'-O)-methyltransferase